MAQTCTLTITDKTTPKHLDLFFKSVWTFNKPVRLELNTVYCNNLSLGRILSMKKVLDHHRPNSRKYVEFSTVVVKTQFARRLLQIGLAIIRTERPVYVRVLQDI